MGERRRQIEEKIDQLLFRDAPSRMAFVLEDLFENHAEPREKTESPRIHFSHQDLADLTGLTRPTATTLLNQFRQEDIIEMGRREITLLDPGKLRQKVQLDE